MEVDIIKLVKKELKYKRGNAITKSALINYKNLTDSCYGCGQQDTNLKIVHYFSKISL